MSENTPLTVQDRFQTVFGQNHADVLMQYEQQIPVQNATSLEQRAYSSLIWVTVDKTPPEILQTAQDRFGFYFGMLAALAMTQARKNPALTPTITPIENLYPRLWERMLNTPPPSNMNQPAPEASFSDVMQELMQDMMEEVGSDDPDIKFQAYEIQKDGVKPVDITTLFADKSDAKPSETKANLYPFSIEGFAAGLHVLGQALPEPVSEHLHRYLTREKDVNMRGLFADSDMLQMMADDAGAFLHRARMHVKLPAKTNNPASPFRAAYRLV